MLHEFKKQIAELLDSAARHETDHQKLDEFLRDIQDDINDRLSAIGSDEERRREEWGEELTEDERVEIDNLVRGYALSSEDFNQEF